MTLDQMRMLVKIEETGSVLAAAGALYRTQPTVSVGIRKLEDELGIQLLARDGYRARLTPAGKKLCHEAKSVLRKTAEMRLMAQYLATGHEPELNIAVEASCPMPLVLDVLRQVDKRYPHTRFNLMAENIWGALERLKLGEVDLAISPWFEEDTELESFVLMNATLTAVASPDFAPLAEPGQLDYERLKKEVQVIVNDSSRRPREKKWGVVKDGRHWLVNDHTTKKEILLAGLGWGRLQRHLIETELTNGKLVQLDIENYQADLTIEIRVARDLDRPTGPVAGELWRAFERQKR